MDYNRKSTTVTIPANKRSQSFTINIINDNITECDETFKLSLSIPSTPCEIVRGKNNITSEVMIKQDDDGERSVSDILVNHIIDRKQKQFCHLTNHNILLKRTSLHYQLV